MECIEAPTEVDIFNTAKIQRICMHSSMDEAGKELDLQLSKSVVLS
jgi:hypothetical protein